MRTLASQDRGLAANEPGALGLKEAIEEMGRDEQEEWEYEYSATETESYYLTLELSYPEFSDRTVKVPRHGRGGYYKTWLEQPMDRAGSTILQRARTEVTDANNDDDEPIPAAEADPATDDEMTNLHPALRDKGKGVDRRDTILDAEMTNLDPALRNAGGSTDGASPAMDDEMANVHPALRDKGKRVDRGDAILDDNIVNLDPALMDPGESINRASPATDDEMSSVDPTTRDKGKGVDRGGPREGSQEGPHAAPQLDRPAVQSRETDKDEEDGQEDIQILDLHSDNPIISYRGRVFEGEWAEVLGTELILADRETGVSLPALRHLNDGVDVLAASASRILTVEKRLEPKVPVVDSLAPIRQEWNIRIPTKKDRTGERMQQTRFLENLIALKMKKGEEDLVTVYAKDGEGKNFKDNKDPSYRPRRKRLPEGIEPASVRRRTGRRPGRPRIRGTVLVRGAGGRPTGPVGNTLSTPTPLQWDHLSRRHDEENDASEDDEGEAYHEGLGSDMDDDPDDDVDMDG